MRISVSMSGQHHVYFLRLQTVWESPQIFRIWLYRADYVPTIGCGLFDEIFQGVRFCFFINGFTRYGGKLGYLTQCFGSKGTNGGVFLKGSGGYFYREIYLFINIPIIRGFVDAEHHRYAHLRAYQWC